MGRSRRPVRRSPKSDPQRYRVYRMEEETIYGKTVRMSRLSLKLLRQIANSVSRSFQVEKPKVRFAKMHGWSGEWEDGVIRLDPKKGANMIVLAHELAHHIHEEIVPDNEHQDHGRQFLGCYMAVLDVLRIVPVVATRAIFEEYKLDYLDPGKTITLNTLRRRLRSK